MNKVYLIFCLHNHQPVGNFDHVFENNYAQAYLPFLDTFEHFKDLKIGLHCSGPLWDWLLTSHPEYIERVRELVQHGSIEILGGAYYEPILSMIPEPDRAGQINMMREFIKDAFNQDAGGFWLAERVWEQEMVSSLADAGIRYTLVDDSHFKNAGLLAEHLNGYYITEDHRKLISVFGTNEQLRYMIPFNEADEIRNYLWETAGQNPGCLLVYGDDGEKFGGWPGTHDWVYNRGWLERFFSMLRDCSEWIELITPQQALDWIKPLGKIYIPDSSYREMMEWALPVKAGRQYEHVVNTIREQPVWNEAASFMRGGFWRNFKHKYSESNQMYARMTEISEKIAKLKNAPEDARKSLYKAQCNCPYWHGVFGGLYLNHLRFETYRNLIRADALLTDNKSKGKDFLLTEKADFDLDGREETVLQNKWHRLYVQPHAGGRIYEWDYYPASTNLLDTLCRREESYHKAIREASGVEGEEGVASIHDMEKLRDPSVKNYLIYDLYERKSFLDHFISGDISAERLRRNECSEHGPLPLREYESKILKIKNKLKLALAFNGEIEIDGVQRLIELTKTLTLQTNNSDLECAYTIACKSESGLQCNFGMEWNFAMLAGQADDRYYFCDKEENSGRLITELQKQDVRIFGLVDEWQRIRIQFQYSEPVTLFTFPIETVSQSESAYEKVYQSSVFYPVVTLNLKSGEKKTFSFTVKIDSLK